MGIEKKTSNRNRKLTRMEIEKQTSKVFITEQ